MTAPDHIPLPDHIRRTLAQLAAAGQDYESLLTVYRMGYLAAVADQAQAREAAIDESTCTTVPLFLRRQAH